jgi:hypothetical protein
MQLAGQNILYTITESFNLMSVSASGQSQTIHLLDNSCSELEPGTPPYHFYYTCYEISPNEVIPTNEGGKLITWSEFRGDAFCSPPDCPYTRNNHFIVIPDGGSPTDHVISTTATAETPTGRVVVGDSGVFYQANYDSISSANYNTGQALWTYASNSGVPNLKLAAVDDNGANQALAIEEDETLSTHTFAMLRLDASGNKTYEPWLSPNGGTNDLFGSLLSPEIADVNSYYGILVGGIKKIVKVASVPPDAVASMWPEPGADKARSRQATPKLEIRYDDNQCSGFDDSKVNNATEYWLMVPATSQNTVTVRVNGAWDRVDFVSSDPSVTVSPLHPSGNVTTLTVTTTAAVNNSTFYIQAIHHPVPEESVEIGKIKLSTKSRITKTADIFVITDNVNNLVPSESGIPSQSQLQPYLDSVWKKQTNVDFQISGRTNKNVNWDILPTAAGDGFMNDWTQGQAAEISAITNAIYPPADLTHNWLVYINAFIPSLGVDGLTGNGTNESFIAANTTATPNTTAAHELGHQLGAVDTIPAPDPRHPDGIVNPKFKGSLMWHRTGEQGCRLRKFEWDTVNP